MNAAGISGVPQLLKDFTARINDAIDWYLMLGLKYDQNWVLDDRGFGDADATKGLPILSTNIVSGYGDYLFDTDMLMVEQVFCADANGNFNELLPEDDKSSPDLYTKPTQTGTPTKYSLIGNSIVTNFIPNYSIAKGLKVKSRRVGRHFLSTDGAIPLGLPPVYFGPIARKASYPYVMEKGLKHAAALKKEIGSDNPRDPYYGGDGLAIANFMSQRGRPRRMRMMGGRQNNR